MPGRADAEPIPVAGDEGPSTLDAIRRIVSELGTGAVQGAGETAVSLGNVVHSIPGVGNITDALAKLVGPEGTDPSAAFEQEAGDIASQGTGYTGTPAEQAGRFGEKVGEFLVPGSKLAKAGEKAAVLLTPDKLINASPKAGRVMSALMGILGRSAGEAGQAGTISALQGEQNPEHEAAIAGTAPVAASGIAATLPLLRSPLLQKLLSIMAGATVASQASSLGGSMGAGLGIYGGTRAALNELLKNPRLVSSMQRGTRKALPIAGRTAAAVEVERRRR